MSHVLQSHEPPRDPHFSFAAISNSRALDFRRSDKPVAATSAALLAVEPRPATGIRTYTFEEMTIEQAISDPMIAMVNAADGVDSRWFIQLLQSASRALR
ncbi:hypothetical protein [Rhizobium gallicum]|uniref:hypothetical protein n=1 Tax=Rhizobium gallicum TaxID=56730 RepID=UPI001EF951D4|nr:hypothetical protein [Rhizobium gallicum]ULJ75788.1 hypothetical protein L2W42_25010 [Rhizobium gallicum]